MRRIRSWMIVLAVLMTAASAWAEVRLPGLIGSHMVLQRNEPVRLWGWADPGEAITVTFRDQKVRAVADGTGRWEVQLEPMEAGGPDTLTIDGSLTWGEAPLEDVMVGEVWVASGQSNMQMALQGTVNAEEAIAAANYPNMRIFQVTRDPQATPREDVAGGEWQQVTPDSARWFSGVAYYFGRDIHEALDVPVGIIHSSWGGSPVEAWTPQEALDAEPGAAPVAQRWAEYEQKLPGIERQYWNSVEEWIQKMQEAEAKGEKGPEKPDMPWVMRRFIWPAHLYNGMIAPLLPYSIRGVIWYQGEANAPRAYEYRTTFPLMIRSWREAWGEPEMPFGFVQLPNFREAKEEPAESDWAELREAQALALELPNTGMAVTLELGNPKDIHPANKRDVGHRLALWALGAVYGQDVVFASPMYQSMEREGDRIRLKFDHVDGGLVVKGDQLKGFAIAGADRKFVWANAEIDGDDVVVWSEQVPEPVAVRYGWADNPEATLYNEAGLPASPFRTDDWPGMTQGK